MSDQITEDDLASAVQMAMAGFEDAFDQIHDDEQAQPPPPPQQDQQQQDNVDITGQDQLIHNSEGVQDDFELELQRQIEEQFQAQINAGLDIQEQGQEHPDLIQSQPEQLQDQSQQQLGQAEVAQEDVDMDLFGEDDFAKEVERQLQQQLELVQTDSKDTVQQQQQQAEHVSQEQTIPAETEQAQILRDVEPVVEQKKQSPEPEVKDSQQQQQQQPADLDTLPTTTTTATAEQPKDDLISTMNEQYDQELQQQIMDALNGNDSIPATQPVASTDNTVNGSGEIDENDLFAQELQKQIMDAFAATSIEEPTEAQQQEDVQLQQDRGDVSMAEASIGEKKVDNGSNEDEFERALQQQIMDVFDNAGSTKQTEKTQPQEKAPIVTAEPVVSKQPVEEPAPEFDSVFEEELHKQIMEAFNDAQSNTVTPVSQPAQPPQQPVQLQPVPGTSYQQPKLPPAPPQDYSQPTQQPLPLALQQAPIEDDTDYGFFASTEDYTLDDDDPYKDALAELVKSVVDSQIESHQQLQQSQGLPEDEDLDMNQIMENALAMAVEDPASLLQSLNLNQVNTESGALLGQILQQQVENVQTTKGQQKKKTTAKEKKPKEKKPKAPKKTAAAKKKEAAAAAAAAAASASASATSSPSSLGNTGNTVAGAQGVPAQLNGVPVIRPNAPFPHFPYGAQPTTSVPARPFGGVPPHQQIKRGPLPIIPNQNLPLRNIIPTHAKLLSRQISELHQSNRLSTALEAGKAPAPYTGKSAQAGGSSKSSKATGNKKLSIAETLALTRSSMSSGKFSSKLQEDQAREAQAKSQPRPSTTPVTGQRVAQSSSAGAIATKATTTAANSTTTPTAKGKTSATTTTQPARPFRPQIPLSQIKQMIKNVDTSGLYNLGRKFTSAVTSNVQAPSTSTTAPSTTSVTPTVATAASSTSESSGTSVSSDSGNSKPSSATSSAVPETPVSKEVRRKDTKSNSSSSVVAAAVAATPSQPTKSSDSLSDPAAKETTPKPASIVSTNAKESEATPRSSGSGSLPVAPVAQGNAIMSNISALLPNLPSNLTSLIATAITNSLNSSFNQQKENEGVKTAKRKTVPVLKDETPQEQRERVRIENRERKKRWRDANKLKNQNNDLRARLKKRANQLFGMGPSEKKDGWIEEEFHKRKTRRGIRSGNLEDLTALINETVQKLDVGSLNEQNITKIVSDLVNNALSSANQQALKDQEFGSQTPYGKDDEDFDRTPSPGSSRQNSNRFYPISGGVSDSVDNGRTTVGDMELGQILQMASSGDRAAEKSSHAAAGPASRKVTTKSAAGTEKAGLPGLSSPIKMNKPTASTSSNLGQTGVQSPVSSSSAAVNSLRKNAPKPSATTTASTSLKRPGDGFPKFNFKKMKISLIPISQSKGTSDPSPVVSSSVLVTEKSGTDSTDTAARVSPVGSAPMKPATAVSKASTPVTSQVEVQKQDTATVPTATATTTEKDEDIVMLDAKSVTPPTPTPVPNKTPVAVVPTPAPLPAVVVVDPKEAELKEIQRLKALGTLQRPPIVIVDKKHDTENKEDKAKSSTVESVTDRAMIDPLLLGGSESNVTEKSSGEVTKSASSTPVASISSSGIMSKAKPILTRPKFGGGVKKPPVFQGLRKPGAFARPIEREKKRVNV